MSGLDKIVEENEVEKNLNEEVSEKENLDSQVMAPPIISNNDLVSVSTNPVIVDEKRLEQSVVEPVVPLSFNNLNSTVDITANNIQLNEEISEKENLNSQVMTPPIMLNDNLMFSATDSSTNQVSESSVLKPNSSLSPNNSNSEQPKFFSFDFINNNQSNS